MKPEKVYELLEEVRKENERVFVRLERYLNVERIVFGIVGAALLAVFTSLLALVVRK